VIGGWEASSGLIRFNFAVCSKIGVSELMYMAFVSSCDDGTEVTDEAWSFDLKQMVV
jgi:hypothetical protein